MKIVITDKIESFTEEYRQKLRDLGAVIYDDIPDDAATIIERIKDAELITINWVKLTPEIIDGAPNLKYVVTPAVGYDGIDAQYAQSKGIKVINCPTFNSQAVAEHAIALLFAVDRRIIEAQESLRNGEWSKHTLQGLELSGKRFGLIGHGNVGKRVERLGRGLGMEVSFVNSQSSNETINELVQAVDVLCICAPLNDRTRHMIDGRRLELLKSTAIIINVGRGAVIDQDALLTTLREGKIRGAGLDVFENEPLDGAPNQAILELAALPNVVATPHIAYNTVESVQKLNEEMYANIQSCVAGEPQNVVNA